MLDDDERLVEAFRVVLEARGFEVSGAHDAAGALDWLRDADGDEARVVVADLGLPDVRGLDLVRLLAGRGSESRLLVLTGESDPDLERRCREAGAAGFLTKPVGGKQLAHAIRAVLGEPPGGSD